MGSEKYKNETGYSDHIASHGGATNADTQFELTNYTFQVQYSGLQKTLDMCANNFASPLLKQEAMESVMKTVED